MLSRELAASQPGISLLFPDLPTAFWARDFTSPLVFGGRCC